MRRDGHAARVELGKLEASELRKRPFQGAELYGSTSVDGALAGGRKRKHAPPDGGDPSHKLMDNDCTEGPEKRKRVERYAEAGDRQKENREPKIDLEKTPVVEKQPSSVYAVRGPKPAAVCQVGPSKEENEGIGTKLKENQDPLVEKESVKIIKQEPEVSNSVSAFSVPQESSSFPDSKAEHCGERRFGDRDTLTNSLQTQTNCARTETSQISEPNVNKARCELQTVMRDFRAEMARVLTNKGKLRAEKSQLILSRVAHINSDLCRSEFGPKAFMDPGLPLALASLHGRTFKAAGSSPLSEGRLHTELPPTQGPGSPTGRGAGGGGQGGARQAAGHG